MKELFLIILIIALFSFGYFIMKQIDEFLTENQSQITDNHDSKTQGSKTYLPVLKWILHIGGHES